MNKNRREAGVLLHPTSLPSRWGVGDLGSNAYKFIDRLQRAQAHLWQVLPLGPVGAGDSPYATRSTFAGNELLIDIEDLYEKGYLEVEDVRGKQIVSERVDYNKVRELKYPLLIKAAKAFLKEDDKEYESFKRKNGWWLKDYALFQVLCNVYNDSRWFSKWPEELKRRDEKALRKVRKEYAEEIEVYSALQYFFFSQWMRLKKYANEHEIRIIGDIPIFVASDSVDAWTNTKLFKMDEKYNQKVNSGVPPDAFSATGQLWGNPVYDWAEHERTGYEWWVNRLKETLKLVDIVRIDHFRGFAACWEVPAKEKTAMKGKWVKGPGQKLIDAFKKALGDDLPLIAEDLGVITPDVEELRDSNNLPGMKILQFAFSSWGGRLDTSNYYLPHNIDENSVVYTGTHDNNTNVGWFRSLDWGTQDVVRRYLECDDDAVCYKLVRAALMCRSKWAICPMQDVLGLDESARMNVPSTCGSSNWSWKLSQEMLDDEYNMQGFTNNILLSGRA